MFLINIIPCSVVIYDFVKFDDPIGANVAFKLFKIFVIRNFKVLFSWILLFSKVVVAVVLFN